MSGESDLIMGYFLTFCNDENNKSEKDGFKIEKP